MNLLIVILVVLAVATYEVSGEAVEDHNYGKHELVDTSGSQRDIISGGLFDSESDTSQDVHEKSWGSVGKQDNHGKETDIDRRFKNEITNRYPKYFYGIDYYDNNRNYKNRIYENENNRNDGFEGENDKFLYSVYNSYHPSGFLQYGNTVGGSKEIDTSTTTNGLLPVLQHNSFTFKRPPQVPLSRRIIVPVPTPTQVEVPVPQEVEMPYLVPYQEHPSIMYSAKFPVPKSVPVEYSVPKPYPVDILRPASVPEPIMLNAPQPFHHSTEFGNGLKFGGKSRKTFPNINIPSFSQGGVQYNRQANHENDYSGRTNIKSVNFYNFKGSQRPVHETNFRNIHPYSTYSAPSAPQSSGLYRSSQNYLHSRNLKSGKLYTSNPPKTLNKDRNIGFRYSFSAPFSHLSQENDLNRIKYVHGSKAPFRNYACFA